MTAIDARAGLAVYEFGDTFDPASYDQENGGGLAARVITRVRLTGSIQARPAGAQA
ncbi:hypothetical protein [Streptomyces longispororuber]|uniref:hypothetical protein n=1 Tax=Streptomyces longispororuber TaxID=68230 RepID=UPI0036F51E44